MRIAVLLMAIATSASAAPTIQISSVPAYGVPGLVAGSVTGVDFAAHGVAAYIYIDGLGWFTKPTFDAPTVQISAEGSFSVDVATGGVDDRATLYCVALVANGASPPSANGAVRIPAALFALAVDCEERYGTTLSFKGLRWAVKEAPAAVGPNGNWFSDSPGSVWVDAQGLHLKIRFDGTRWTAAEVILIDAARRGVYGRARIQTNSRLDVLDANATFGFFTWDPHGDGSPVNPTRELDIEASRWGNPSDPTNAQFAVQPYTTAGNLVRYTLPDLSSDARLTHLLDWQPGRIGFSAASGSSPSAVIRELVYTEDAAANHFVPEPGRSALHLNLWLNAAAPLAPANGQPVEVVITDFSLDPPQAVPALSGPVFLGLAAGLLALVMVGTYYAPDR